MSRLPASIMTDFNIYVYNDDGEIKNYAGTIDIDLNIYDWNVYQQSHMIQYSVIHFGRDVFNFW